MIEDQEYELPNAVTESQDAGPDNVVDDPNPGTDGDVWGEEFKKDKVGFCKHWSAELYEQYKKLGTETNYGSDLLGRLLHFISGGKISTIIPVEVFQQIGTYGQFGYMLILMSSPSLESSNLESSKSFGSIYKGSQLMGLGAIAAYGLYGYVEGKGVSSPITQMQAANSGLRIFKLDVPLDADPKVDNYQFSEWCKENNYPFASVIVPSPAACESNTLYGGKVTESGAYEPGTSFYKQLKPDHTVQHTLSFKNFPIDEFFATVLTNLVVRKQISDDEYNEAYDQTNSMCIGGGSLQGMIGRYKSCMSVLNLFENKEQVYNSTHIDLLFQSLVSFDVEEHFLGTSTIKDFLSVMHVIMTAHRQEQCNEDGVPMRTVKTLLSIKPSANSGLLNNIGAKQRTNEEVGIDDILAMGESILNLALCSADSADTFIKRNFNMFLGNAKNKTEPISKEEITTKTRIFVSFASQATFAAQIANNIWEFSMPDMFFRTFPRKKYPNGDFYDTGKLYDDMPFVFRVNNETDLTSVLKGVIGCNIKSFNPAKGWIARFYTHLQNNLQAGNNIVMYYSDNLTLLSCVKEGEGLVWNLLSVDGKRMESQHSTANRKYFNRLQAALCFKKSCKLQEVFLGVMDQLQTTPWYMNGHFVPPMGMASGYPGTSSQNTFKLLMFILSWIDALHQDAVTESAKSTDRSLVEYTLTEIWSHSSTQLIQDQQCVHLIVEKEQHDVLGSMDLEGVTVLDLLGYDCVNTTLLGVRITCSILRTESILRALATVKNLANVTRISSEHVALKGIDRKATICINRMAKCQSLMLSGAWYRTGRPYYKILVAIFERSKQFLRTYLTKIDEALLAAKYKEICDEENIPLPEADFEIGSLQLFSIVDVIRFQCGETTAELLQKAIAQQDFTQNLEDYFYYASNAQQYSWDLPPLDEEGDMMRDNLEAYDQYLTGALGQKAMGKFTNNILTKGEDYVVAQIKAYLLQLQKNDIILLGCSFGEYKTSIEKATVRSELLLLEFQYRIYSEDPLHQAQRQVLAKAVLGMATQGARVNYVRQSQSQAAKIFGTMVIEMASEISPLLRGPMTMAINNVDMPSAHLQQFLGDFLSRLLPLAREHLFIQSYGIYFKQVASRAEAIAMLKTEMFNPDPLKVPSTLFVKDILASYAAGQQRLEEIEKFWARDQNLANQNQAADEDFFSTQREFTPSMLKRTPNSRSNNRDDKVTQRASRAPQNIDEHYQSQIDNTKRYLTQLSRYLPDLKFVTKANLPTGHVSRFFPIYGDRVVIADLLANNRRNLLVTALPMTKSFQSELLRKNIIKNVGCDEKDLFNVNVKEAISKWKSGLPAHIQMVPMLYRNLSLGSLAQIHDQVIEVIRAVKLRGHNRYLMGMAASLFDSKDDGPQIMFKRYQLLCILNFSFGGSMHLDIYRDSKNLQVVVDYFRANIGNVEGRTLEEKIQLLFNCTRMEPESRVDTEVASLMHHIQELFNRDLSRTASVDNFMAYLRTLGFEPDVLEQPYFTRLKFLLFGCTRRVLITEGSRFLPLTPDSLKIVLHVVSHLSLQNRYDTYCEWVIKYTDLKEPLPSYVNITDAIPILQAHMLSLVNQNALNMRIAMNMETAKSTDFLNSPHAFSGENIRVIRQFIAWIEYPQRFGAHGYHNKMRRTNFVGSAKDSLVELASGGNYLPVFEKEGQWVKSNTYMTCASLGRVIASSQDRGFQFKPSIVSLLSGTHKSMYGLGGELRRLKELHVSKMYEWLVGILSTQVQFHAETFGPMTDVVSANVFNWYTLSALYQTDNPVASANQMTNLGAQIFNALALTQTDLVGNTETEIRENTDARIYMNARYMCSMESYKKGYYRGDSANPGWTFLHKNDDVSGINSYYSEALGLLMSQQLRFNLNLEIQSQSRVQAQENKAQRWTPHEITE